MKLPRKELAPVGVQMGAKIKTTDDTKPPRLTEIILDINSHGLIDAKGLPLCSLGKLTNASAARAKKVCGDAEVGHGNVTSRVGLPGQGEFSTNGPLLAFNGKYKGKQAIFAHVTSKGTLSITYVIIFVVNKTKGTYGTSLVAKVPAIASGSGLHLGVRPLAEAPLHPQGREAQLRLRLLPAAAGRQHRELPVRPFDLRVRRRDRGVERPEEGVQGQGLGASLNASTRMACAALALTAMAMVLLDGLRRRLGLGSDHVVGDDASDAHDRRQPAIDPTAPITKQLATSLPEAEGAARVALRAPTKAIEAGRKACRGKTPLQVREEFIDKRRRASTKTRRR